MDPTFLSEARIVWTGFGATSWPARDENRIVERYGEDIAAPLLERLRELETDFYASDAWHRVADLHAMGDAAAADFKVRHPGISDEAVRALTWCYTFDFR